MNLKPVCFAAAGLMLVIITGSLGAEEIPMAQEAEFPHAGICFAVPQDFEFQTPTEPFEVAKAILRKDGQIIQAISLVALPVEQDVTASQVAEAMAQRQQDDLAVRDRELLKETTMTVAGIEGQARLTKYTFRGRETTAGRVYFLRQCRQTEVCICYMLAVEADAKQQGSLLPILSEVIKTVRLIPVRRPCELAIEKLQQPVPDTQRGYEIRPPQGWYVMADQVGLTLGQTDYPAGGVATMTAQVLVADLPKDMSPQAHANWCLEAMGRSANSIGMATELVSKGPVCTAGLAGYQMTFQQSPASQPAQSQPTTTTSATTSPAEAESPPAEQPPFAVIVQRTISRSQDHKTFIIVLSCRGCKAEVAEAAMEKLAEGFHLLDPAEVGQRGQFPAATQPDSQKEL